MRNSFKSYIQKVSLLSFMPKNLSSGRKKGVQILTYKDLYKLFGFLDADGKENRQADKRKTIQRIQVFVQCLRETVACKTPKATQGRKQSSVNLNSQEPEGKEVMPSFPFFSLRQLDIILISGSIFSVYLIGISIAPQFKDLTTERLVFVVLSVCLAVYLLAFITGRAISYGDKK